MNDYTKLLRLAKKVAIQLALEYVREEFGQDYLTLEMAQTLEMINIDVDDSLETQAELCLFWLECRSDGTPFDYTTKTRHYNLINKYQEIWAGDNGLEPTRIRLIDLTIQELLDDGIKLMGE